jgi:hypothetical protein
MCSYTSVGVPAYRLHAKLADRNPRREVPLLKRHPFGHALSEDLTPMLLTRCRSVCRRVSGHLPAVPRMQLPASPTIQTRYSRNLKPVRLVWSTVICCRRMSGKD